MSSSGFPGSALHGWLHRLPDMKLEIWVLGLAISSGHPMIPESVLYARTADHLEASRSMGR